MKTLILYDTNFGNTQQIAEAISKGIGNNSTHSSVTEIKPQDLEGYDLIIVGSPIIGWKPTEKMAAFLNGIEKGQLNQIKVATFDTRVKLFIHGDAAKKLAVKFKELGGEIVIDPQPFYVKGKDGPLYEGELERAKEWVESIL